MVKGVRLVVELLLVGEVGIAGGMAQVPRSTPAATFEVATVRPSAPDVRESNIGFRAGHFTAKNANIKFILQYAYHLPSGSGDLISGAPAWASSAGFDIDAKEDDVLAARIEAMTLDERGEVLRPMIQALLADRFALKAHYETRERPVLAMTVAKRGSRLTPTSKAVESAGAAGPPRWGGLHNNGQGEMEGRGATLEMLANVLGAQPEVGDRVIVNETGMVGTYDFTLKWTPEAGAGASSEKSNAGVSGPSLFTALEEQLGLKMASRKEPVKVLVIEHLERPSEN